MAISNAPIAHTRKNRGRGRYLPLIGSLLAFLLLAAACADSESDTTADEAPATTAAPAAAAAPTTTEGPDPVVAEAREAVLGYEAGGLSTDKLPADGPPVAPDKLVGIIPCLEASACGFFADISQEAAERIGWDVLRIDGKGTADDQAAAVRQMIAAGVDGIVFHVVPPEAIPQAVKEARDAGIAIVGFAVIDPDELIDYKFPGNETWTNSGRVIADYIIAETDGQAKLLAFVSGDLPNDMIKDAEVIRRIGECRDCEVLVREEFLLTDLQTRNPEAIASAARGNPDANAIFVGFDAALFFAIPELEKLERGDDLFAIAHDANPENQDLIRNGRVHRASPTYDYALAGWEAIDALNRIFNGEDPSGSIAMTHTMRLITPNNVPAEGDTVYGLNYDEFYSNLWGLG